MPDRRQWARLVRQLLRHALRLALRLAFAIDVTQYARQDSNLRPAD